MAIELRQNLKLTQQLILTPQLQMAIKLLQLSRVELIEAVRAELQENPTIEDISDGAAGETTDGSVNLAPTKSDKVEGDSNQEKIQEDIDWSNYIDEYNTPARNSFEAERRESTSFEAFTAKRTSLSDQLLWQLMMISPTQKEKEIGSLIIGNINNIGYIDVSTEELSRLSSADPEEVERVLVRMQTFDPPGVCARNLKECLTIQAKHFGFDQTIVMDIIQNHLNHLENSNYKAIARALRIRIDDVVSAVNIIKSLEPKPARQFSDEDPYYIIPDIYVYKSENDFVIMINDDGMPKLRVSPLYKQAIKRNGSFSRSTKEYIHDKLRSATWLIRSIHQRQQTMYKVMKSIVQFQIEFFEKGIAYLKPMVLRDVAQDIGMHESTISRVTTNKYAHTPQGIFELKYFFNSSISRVHGEAIASTTVQEKIRQIIKNENPKKPYSDSKITRLLKDANIDIARRTVAKYREMLKILPSSKRRQLY